MDNSLKRRRRARKSRIMRVRKGVRGTAQKPRLSVSKTNRHLYAQVIDDEKGVTLFGVGTLVKAQKGSAPKGKSKETAREIGTLIAQKAKEQQIETIVF